MLLSRRSEALPVPVRPSVGGREHQYRHADSISVVGRRGDVQRSNETDDGQRQPPTLDDLRAGPILPTGGR